MICPNCQAENRPGARFCIGCGAPLPAEQAGWSPSPAPETTAWSYPSTQAAPESAYTPPSPAPETAAWPYPAAQAAPEYPSPAPAVAVPAAASVASSVPRRFPVLRVISTFYKVIGIITAGVTLLVALGSCILQIAGSALIMGLERDLGISLPVAGGGIVVALISSLIILLLGALYAAFIYGFGELISLLLAVEENTRLAALR